MNKKFNWRNFISLYIAISFILMFVSGIILFIAPPGRIANWSYWAILGLTKKDWQSIHIIFTFIFVLTGVFHIYYNWKPLMFYLRTKKQSFYILRNELVLAVSVGTVIFAFTLLHLPPVNYILDLGESLTESWESENNNPPLSHAERLTLSELSKSFHIPINKIENKFRESSINFYGFESSLEEIAALNDVTPQQLFAILNTGNKTEKNNSRVGSGLGRLTIDEICTRNNLEQSTVLKRLLLHNIQATGASKIKDIANKNNLIPIDIYNLIIE